MAFDNLAGTWVYRSFRNLTTLLPHIDPNHPAKADIDKWNGYLFGQGEMEFHPGYSGSLSGSFVMGPDLAMDLSGRIADGTPTTLTWHAVGRDGQDSEGWIYEYRGELIPNWANGSRQTDAIVGSVVRTVAHDDLAPLATTDRSASAGVVTSFLMVRKRFKPSREILPLPTILLERLGSRHHRLHHHVWHMTRDHWGELTPKQQDEIDRLGWRPPRPNQKPVRGTVVWRDKDNGAGEDFLFMHRNMLHEVRDFLTEKHLPQIVGWRDIPRPDRRSDNATGFAVAPGWTKAQESKTKSLALIKSDEYMVTRMAFLERHFKDRDYLKSLTLDQLGAKIEWMIHNPMHIRWSSLPMDPADPSQGVPEGRNDFDLAEKWVSFTPPDGGTTYYDDLNDTFASHVNPIFWRLHGWIDDRVDDWANAHVGDVSPRTVDGVPWFEKAGKWVKVDNPWILGSNHSPETMEEVINIMAGRSAVGGTRVSSAKFIDQILPLTASDFRLV